MSCGKLAHKQDIDRHQCPSEVAVSRVQLALNVNDIEQAVSFYTKLFGTEPAKRRPGYANFAIGQPPLKLVLLENPGQGGPLTRPRAQRPPENPGRAPPSPPHASSRARARSSTRTGSPGRPAPTAGSRS